MNTTTNTYKRIAINTGGGDAPGLNAVIHAVVHAAHTHGWDIHGIRDVFHGLLHPEDYPDGGVIKLTRPLVRDIVQLGGTILGTSNFGNPFKTRVPQPDGSFTEIDRSFGAAAVRALVEGHDGVMVAINPPRIDHVPLRVATSKLNLVAADDYGVMPARTLDISFGD